MDKKKTSSSYTHTLFMRPCRPGKTRTQQTFWSRVRVQALIVRECLHQLIGPHRSCVLCKGPSVARSDPSAQMLPLTSSKRQRCDAKGLCLLQQGEQRLLPQLRARNAAVFFADTFKATLSSAQHAGHSYKVAVSQHGPVSRLECMDAVDDFRALGQEHITDTMGSTALNAARSRSRTLQPEDTSEQTHLPIKNSFESSSTITAPWVWRTSP